MRYTGHGGAEGRRASSPFVVLLASLLVFAGCGGESSTEPASTPPPGPAVPDPGALEVAVTTTGDRFDEDGYFVKVPGYGTKSLAVNDEVMYADLPPGDYVVTFGGVAMNCPTTATGDRTVTVEAGATTRLDFDVQCGALAYVANGGESYVSVIAAANNTRIANIEVGPAPLDLVVSPDSAYVYVLVLFDRALKILDVESGRIERSITVGYEPTRAAIEPAGDLVYVTDNYDNTVKVVSTAQPSTIATIPVGDQPRGVTVSPDGERVYVTNVRDGTVSVIDANTRTVVETIDVAFRPTDVAVSPDGERVYVTHGSGYLYAFDTADHSLLGEVVLFGHSNGLALSPDGSMIYATALHADRTDPQEVIVIDAETLEVVKPIDATSTPYAAAVGPDDERLYVTNFDSGVVTVIETATHEVVAGVRVGESPTAVAFVTY